MKNTVIRKTFGLLCFVVSILSFAQIVPPPPENPESGDIGAPTSAIDNYVFILFFVAIALIFFFVKSKKEQQIFL